jgi:hypothetical protein
MHAIGYDAIHDEIVVPRHFGQAVLTLAGDATGETPPRRVIQGSNTQLIAPDRLGIDPQNNEIYVPEGHKVLVYPREGHGNVAPLRVLTGPDTRIGDANAVAIDPIRNLLVVASSPPGRERSGGRQNELTIFNRTAQGNTKPLRVITGVPGHRVTVFPERGLIFVVTDEAYIGVWGIDDAGETPPRYTIGGPKGVLRQPRGVTIDAKHRAVIVSDKDLNAVLTFHVPALFETLSEQEQARR